MGCGDASREYDNDVFTAGGNLTQAGFDTSVNGNLGDVGFSRSGSYLFASTQNGTTVFAFGNDGSLAANAAFPKVGAC